MASLISRRPWHHPIAVIKRLALYALLVYVGLCVFLFAMQTRMVYAGITDVFSPEEATRTAKEFGLVPWERTTPGASGPQGFVRPDFATAPAPRGTVIFFHGNGEAAWNWVGNADAISRRGFRVFMYEYPGYGGRPGTPSETAIVPDAQAVIRSLEQAGYGPIYLWGESLGSGVAAAICADETLPVHGLALAAPWDNIANVGLSFYPFVPVRLLMIDKYDSIANLAHFRHPICVIRGDRDGTVLPRLTLNLFAHLPDPRKMILHAGYGHGDWPSSPDLAWWDEAIDFIAPKK